MTPVAAGANQSFAFQLDEFYLDLQEDGRNIRVLSHDEVAAMPFPGLRPFKTSEFQLFKGRCGQANELIKRLKPAKFLAVIGSSGTGKSSLVRAGLIPELFGASFQEGGNRWNIAVCRPGKNPVANLAVALSSIKAQSKDRSLIHDQYQVFEPLLNQSLYGLLEANERLNKNNPRKANLLIIVDQFEEVFRYDRKDLRENIENHFVDLLLKASGNAKGGVYVVITMRSEFLGDCVKFRGLPEAINRGQYLVPGLNRNELKDVIEGPVSLTGKTMATGLVELLINEIDENRIKENLDQLPILQHALMRTYQEAVRQGADEITYEHYRQTGEMTKSLANHADTIFQELGAAEDGGDYSKKQLIAKVVFQTLTDASTDLKGGRRPTDLKTIYAVAASIGATPAEVDEVIERFRDRDTSFIMPPSSTPLHEALIMDISHESLMRNWDLLKTWVDEETRNGKLYQKLNERREEDGQLIQGQLLVELSNWRQRHPANAAWASRYHAVPGATAGAAAHEDLYNRNLRFLERSEDEAIKARESEKNRFKEEAKRLRDEEFRKQKETSRKVLMRVLAAAVLVAIVLTVGAFRSRNKAMEKEKEATAEKAKADSLVEVLKSKAALIEEARSFAERQRDKALLFSDSLKSQAALLEKARNIAVRKTIEAINLQQQISRQNDQLEKQLVKIDLQRETFYTSPILEADQKEEILQSLYTNPLLRTKAIPFAKHVKTGLLQDVNTAVEVNEDVASYPAYSLRRAEELWQKNKNAAPVVNEILLGMFTQNDFPEQKIEPLVYQNSLNDRAYLFDVDSRSRFALANTDQLITGSPVNNRLVIDNVVWTKPALAGDSNALAPVTQNVDSAWASEGRWNGINALSLDGPNGVLLLQGDSNLVQQLGSESRLLGRLHKNAYPRSSRFVPGGKHLVTLSNDDALLLWDLVNIPANKVLLPDTLSTGPRNRSIRQLVFSPDGQTMAVSFSDKHLELWRLPEKKRITRFGRYPAGQAAALPADSNYLVVAYSTRYADLYDTSGQRLRTSTLFTSARDRNYTTTPIEQIVLSPDWRSLLVNYGRSLCLFTAPDRDSVFKLSNRNNRLLQSKRLLAGDENIRDGRFLNNRTVVLLTDAGSLYRFDVGDGIRDLREAFEGVRPITQSADDEDEENEPDKLAFEKQLREATDMNKLRELGTFYFKKALSENYVQLSQKEARLLRAQQLFTVLAEKDTGFYKQIDSAKLAALQQQLYEIKNSEANALNAAEADTLTQISNLQAAVQEKKEKLLLLPADTVLRQSAASDYWNLSWLTLFTEQYDSAVYYANEAVRLHPARDGVKTNLALAYLFKGEFDKAEEIYRKYKDSAFGNNDGRLFRDSFLQDFDDMERAGKITPANPELYKKVQSIKRDILGMK